MAESATTDAFFSSRPSLKLEGQANSGIEVSLLSLSVHENTDGLFRCEATLGNWGSADSNGERFIYFDRSELDFGKTLNIDMGDGDAAAEIFNGRITAIEGRFPQQKPAEILILAEDRLQDLRMLRRSRSFDNVTVSDVIETIANEHELSTDLDINGPTYTVLTQVNQSDLAFIRECARDIDAEIWIDGNILHAQSRSRRQTETLSLSYGHRLLEFSVCADLAHQRSKVRVSGWDVAAKESIIHSSDEMAIQGELEDQSSGGQLLTEIFGQRVDQLVHQVPHTNDEARNMAEASYRRTARRFLTGHGLSEGDGRIRAGTHIVLNDLGPLFSGKYYVSEVTHNYDSRNGFRSSFRVERPGLGRS